MQDRMTAAEYCALKTKSKYGNSKAEADGYVFDSQREMKRYFELKYLQQAGEISGLRLQVPFELIPKQMENGKCVERAVKYIADFVYMDRNGNLVVEDSKGYRTDVFLLKKKLMLYLWGIKIIET